MKRGLLVLLAMCSLAAAMVPKDRKAVQTETIKAGKPKLRCAHNTPCAWTVYETRTGVTEMTITNEYCICEDNMECQIEEDYVEFNTAAHRCRVPDTKTEKS